MLCFSSSSRFQLKCHLSGVTCKMTSVSFFSFFYKVIGLVMVWSTPSSFYGCVNKFTCWILFVTTEFFYSVYGKCCYTNFNTKQIKKCCSSLKKIINLQYVKNFTIVFLYKKPNKCCLFKHFLSPRCLYERSSKNIFNLWHQFNINILHSVLIFIV